MRILLLTHYYAPETGAPQHRWGALARHLGALGHDLHVIAPSPHYPHGTLVAEHRHLRPGTTHCGAAGETVHRTAFRPYDDRVRTRLVDEAVAALAAVRSVPRVLGAWRPEVVVATVPSLAMLFAGLLVSRRLRVPLVAEIRDAWPDLLVVADEWEDRRTHGPRAGLALVGRRAIAGLAAITTAGQRAARAVVTTTDAFAEVLRGRGVPEVHVVRNAAHAVVGYQERGPRHEGELRVLYAGTVGRAQGLGSAVEAAALLAERGVGVRLRVLGLGADRVALQLLAERLGAPVEFLAPVDRGRMAEHYAWADTVLVSLRAWPALELAVPSKLYEVMALGLHVTAAVSGEAREIVEGRHAGHVTTPGDVEQLADVWESLSVDRELLEVPPLGREWVAQHTASARLADDYAEILASVVRRA